MFTTLVGNPAKWGMGGAVWGESEILLGGIFLPDEGNLRNSDFGDLSLFQN